MKARNPRQTYEYRKRRKAFLIAHKRSSGCCDRCGVAMDYSGKGRTHRRTATIEHTIPVEHRPDLALDVTLWRAWCLSCNSAGNRNRNAPTAAPVVVVQQREW